MRQGPQNPKEAAQFVVGIVRSRLWDRRAHRSGSPLATFDTDEGRRDPYPIHEQVRALGRVVPGMPGYLATAEYDLCHDLLRRRDFGVRDPSTNVVHGAIYQGDSIDRSILGLNPPDHTRLRRLAAHGFSPKQLASYEVSIEKRVETLIDSRRGTAVVRHRPRRRRATADRRDQRPARAAGRGRRCVREVRRDAGVDPRRDHDVQARPTGRVDRVVPGRTDPGAAVRAAPRPTRATTWSAIWSRPRPTVS